MALPAVQKVIAPGRYGNAESPAGVRVSEVIGFSLALIMARRGQWSETAKIAFRLYGSDPPARPAAVLGTTTLIWSGPDQFMALSPASSDQSSVDAVRAAFAGVASVSDQSDGRCLVRLSGTRVRECLAKLCSVDLHESAFPIGAAAAASIDHSAVNMWRGADGLHLDPVFYILVFASFAESVWHAILEAASEYRVEPTSAAQNL
jgi:sarcosine oxidase subunit gamma